MHFLEKYRLACLDFDGLLVDTEPLHYHAYTTACQEYGVPLGLDFSAYKELSHNAKEGLLERHVLLSFPNFRTPWPELKAHAKKIYRSLLTKETVSLMPGVENFLSFLKEKEIAFCVVTNSARAEITPLLAPHPCLQEIPLWITRECYQNAKPKPDGYLTARSHFPHIPQAAIIGFEDTLRGVAALKAAGITPVLIGEIDQDLPPSLYHFPSFTSMVM